MLFFQVKNGLNAGNNNNNNNHLISFLCGGQNLGSGWSCS